jgi:hypothetical protein
MKCKLNTHLATESDIALALTANGNISPVTTQAIGPQVLAKNAMYIQMRATNAFWPEEFVTEIVTPIIATYIESVISTIRRN